MSGVGIVGLGQCIPATVITNDDIEIATPYPRAGKGGQALDEWASGRHGGRRRRQVAAGDDPFMRVRFSLVQRWSVGRMLDAARTALELAGLRTSDISWLVAHQASSRIVRAAAAELDIGEDRVVLTYPETGTTSGSSVLVTWHSLYRGDRLRDGDVILVCSVGTGMAWGAAIYRWAGREFR